MARKDITDELVCLVYSIRQSHQAWPYEMLSGLTGEPEKVCFSAIERAYNRGLIEYGVSLRSGWLTEKGNELVKYIFSLDE